MIALIFVAVIVLVVLVVIITAMLFRRVVATNEVHIIQSAKNTTSFGKDTGNGNTYYEWPSWLPIIGVTKIVLPVSVFDINLNGYEAYDKGRVPFIVDITAFFRIKDSNVAAQRVSSFSELIEQLRAIIQGSVRTILSSHEIEDIMHSRSTFGDSFTKEVREQLASWGVETVKNLELMDIRDSQDSNVIRNIMEKKKSLIEMQSRVEVAENIKNAEIAEINAEQATQIQEQIAKQVVGLKTVESQREVDISAQKAAQLVKEQEKVTKEKEMEVIKVADVKRAEITKDVNVVKAEEVKQTAIINAEEVKQKDILKAEALLEMKSKESKGIELEGAARAQSEKLMQMAPIEAQISLAQEIGENQGYQSYLISIRQIEASQAIGIEQAKALDKADIKIIANANNGNVNDGLNSVSEFFSAKGGTQLGAMLEGLAQSEVGKSLLDKFTAKKENK
ncbi:SPFH domain-containing protein [uncultured Helicobacter sp.]|uniref:SPFH domain-containing protein n=1 Tax=uncultured Helicobacter sp. TaxID=175537 RepID=UPI002593B13C|nr:SPFH domain-containing protein [uncultured Helicobacter sp.]